MRTKIEEQYFKHGINYKSNKALIKYLDFLDTDQEKIRQSFELFHMDLILGLEYIQKKDKKAFNRYIKTLNDTNGNTNFWGEKFEIYMHYKLLKGLPNFINNLKRGKDGLEPDLTFEYNGNRLGIELTTRQFITPPKNETEILNKITEKILEKNRKKYADENCALIMDITNIITYENLYNINLNNIFKKHFEGFSYLGIEIKFGMIVLVNSVFKFDKELTHVLNPLLGIKSEKKEMNLSLNKFLNILFNEFKQNNCEGFEIYHPNI